MTKAQQVANLFDNNGTVFFDSDGCEFDFVCEQEMGGYRSQEDPYIYRYDFDDGSCITVTNGIWDLS